MSSLGDLVVNIGASTAGLRAGFGAAQGMLSGFGSTLAIALGGGTALAAAQEAAQAQAKLGAVLASTGGAAGLTAGEITQLAKDLMMVTNFGDDATVSAAAVLATFTQIKGDVFKEALMSAQDLSSVLEQDLQSSVIQIGKALNDPIKGVTALRRVGVSFTASQLDQIKAMVAAGDVMGAQQLILAELKTEFGGAARAMADPMIQLKNAVGEVAEEIGKALMPIVRLAAETIIPFLVTWGQQLAAVGVAVLGLVGILKTIIVVQRAIAVGQALIMSLGGPAGWATLAAGAAIFAGATLLINNEMGALKADTDAATAKAATFKSKLGEIGTALGSGNATKAELKEFTRLLEEAEPPFARLAANFKRLEGIAESGGFDIGELALAKDIERDKMTHFTDSVKKLNDEIAILGNAAAEAWFPVRDLLHAGGTAKQADELEGLIAKRDELKKQKGLMDDLASAAKRITEETRTPFEKFEAQVAKLNEMKDAGLIDDATFGRAMEDAEKDLDKASGKGDIKEIGAVGAAAEGSREALSSIFSAMRSTGSDKQAQMVKLIMQQLKEQEQQTAALQAIAATGTAEAVEI